MDQTPAAEQQPRFAVCVRNDGYPLDLSLRRVYRVLPDPWGARSGWIRVIDDTGEDYLYPAVYFRPLELRDKIAR